MLPVHILESKYWDENHLSFSISLLFMQSSERLLLFFKHYNIQFINCKVYFAGSQIASAHLLKALKKASRSALTHTPWEMQHRCDNSNVPAATFSMSIAALTHRSQAKPNLRRSSENVLPHLSKGPLENTILLLNVRCCQPSGWPLGLPPWKDTKHRLMPCTAKHKWVI